MLASQNDIIPSKLNIEPYQVFQLRSAAEAAGVKWPGSKKLASTTWLNLSDDHINKMMAVLDTFGKKTAPRSDRAVFQAFKENPTFDSYARLVYRLGKMKKAELHDVAHKLEFSLPENLRTNEELVSCISASVAKRFSLALVRTANKPSISLNTQCVRELDEVVRPAASSISSETPYAFDEVTTIQRQAFPEKMRDILPKFNIKSIREFLTASSVGVKSTDKEVLVNAALDHLRKNWVNFAEFRKAVRELNMSYVMDYADEFDQDFA